ncbi:hypothetical protein AVEN_125890-1 [Araneus ventricosus]|uniref:Uncharacterized protein n=1 Tax=Araneus ventricosus TaxID=182803 RepID=A0A4Y2NNW4_ARAVE|nr:hypothetical protein AVEN_125890-1 [Araneus ventricosus]
MSKELQTTDTKVLNSQNIQFTSFRKHEKQSPPTLKCVPSRFTRATCQNLSSPCRIRSELNGSSLLHQDPAKISQTSGSLPPEPGKDTLNMCLSDPVDRYTALFICGKCRL